MSVSVSRRFILGTGCAAVGGLLLPPTAARSATSDAEVHSVRVGEAQITIVSDGSMSLPQSFLLPDRDVAEIGALFAPREPSFAMAMNVAIVRIGAQTVLLDCGGGTDFMPGMGQLADVISKTGIDESSITDVVLTHAHPDHLWGIIDPFEEASRFPNAHHFIAAPERDFWLQSDVESRVPADLQGVAAGTRRRLELLKEQLSVCAPDDEIAPGLRVVNTAGHTPGHLSLHLSSKGEELFLAGDVLSHPLISFAKPDWRWGSDMNVEQAASVRARTLDMLAHDRVSLLGYHLPWPGVGMVERSGTSYRFVAR
jgi:glyoxylase-like metal-dependent hydrolase (beta-lactamase superfamily II)